MNEATKQLFESVSAYSKCCLTDQNLSEIVEKVKKFVDAGADINAVSEMLGHTDVVTTRVYNQVLKNNIKKIYKKAHPRA